VSIIGWIIVGAVGGYAANFILGRQSTGVIRTVIFGIAGAIIGGLIGGFIATGDLDLNHLMNNFDLTSIVVAIIGAVGLGLVSAYVEKNRAAV
jgi:uncharacterized membrane protein YeaQ/YmgE (transglycosylase-associated protein family)